MGCSQTSGVWGPWGLGNVVHPLPHHAAQPEWPMPGTSVSHVEASPVSQPPGEAEQTSSTPGKLLKAVQGQAHPLGRSSLLRPPGRVHPIHPSNDTLCCTNTGATIQLPPLMAIGTGLRLLPCCDNPHCKTPVPNKAGGLAWSLSKKRSRPKLSPASCSQRPEGKTMSEVSGKHFGNEKISLSECGTV